MQDQVFYEDHELRITASEIRCKQLTIRADSITSVSIASARPAKWLPLFFLIPMVPLGFIFILISRFAGHSRSPLLFLPILIVLIPLAVILTLASLLRISRIHLQTSGGPVILALKIQLTDPAATVARFQTIKDAIEKAMQVSHVQ